MDISLLREFVELAGTLSFTLTANKLFISRSALSKRILTLEKELGAPLFYRTTHNVELTEAGRVFLSHIEPLVAGYDAAVAKVHRMVAETKNELHIGFLDAAARSILIPTIQRMMGRYPKTSLRLTSYELGELERALANDEIDLAITIQLTNSVLREGWCFEELYTDGLSVMVPLSSPMANRVSIRFEEILDEPLILPDSAHYLDLGEIVRQMAEKVGRPAHTRAEYSHIEGAVILVEGGTACAILPKHCDSFPHNNSCFIDLEDEEAIIRVGVLYKSMNSNPAIPAVLEELKRFSEDLS